MTISFVAAGVSASLGGAQAQRAITPALPTGWAAEDFLYAPIVTKSSAAAAPTGGTVNTPTGWTLRVPQRIDGTPALTADGGSIEGRQYDREAQSGETAATFTLTTAVSDSGNMILGHVIGYRKASGTTWDAGDCGACPYVYNQGNATYTYTATTDPGFQAGDWAVFSASNATDGGTFTLSSVTIPGCTLGTPVQRASDTTSQGADARVATWDVPVVSGSSTGVAQFVVATSIARNSVGHMLRLREVSSGAAYDKAPADPVGVTDSATGVVQADRTQGDPVGVADNAAAAVGGVRGVADPVAATDSASPVVDAARAPADQVGVTDSVTADLVAGGSGVTRSPADPVGVTDQAAPVQAAQRVLPDPVGLSDTLSQSQAAVRAQGDAVGATDAVARTLATVRAVQDPVGVTDLVTADLVGSGSATVSDPVEVTDALVLEVGRALVVADPVPVTDTAAPALAGARGPGDQAAVTDAVAVTVGRVRAASDQVGVSDAVEAVLFTPATLPPPPVRIIRSLPRTSTAWGSEPGRIIQARPSAGGSMGGIIQAGEE